MKIGGGSTTELIIEVTNNTFIINQGEAWVKIHLDDIPEVIEALKRYAYCTGYFKLSDRNLCLFDSFKK